MKGDIYPRDGTLADAHFGGNPALFSPRFQQGDDLAAFFVAYEYAGRHTCNSP
jgi:hypothetical protein